MTADLIYFALTTAVTVATGIIGYFLKKTMDRIEHTTKNEDFIRVMTRLENKIDQLQRSE